MPQFVVLAHDHPHLHWDLMLDVGHTLQTWRLEARPLIPADIPCEAIADHRTEYLTYEGPVSGQRGTVIREFSGKYNRIVDAEDRLTVDLTAQGLHGRLTITPPAGRGVASFRPHAAPSGAQGL